MSKDFLLDWFEGTETEALTAFIIKFPTLISFFLAVLPPPPPPHAPRPICNSDTSCMIGTVFRYGFLSFACYHYFVFIRLLSCLRFGHCMTSLGKRFLLPIT